MAQWPSLPAPMPSDPLRAIGVPCTLQSLVKYRIDEWPGLFEKLSCGDQWVTGKRGLICSGRVFEQGW